jgi:hypothetical protein
MFKEVRQETWTQDVEGITFVQQLVIKLSDFYLRFRRVRR